MADNLVHPQANPYPITQPPGISVCAVPLRDSRLAEAKLFVQIKPDRHIVQYCAELELLRHFAI